MKSVTNMNHSSKHHVSSVEYLYRLTENNTGQDVFFGIQICEPEGSTILFELENLSEDQKFIQHLIDIMAEENVEPGQALYVTHDYIAGAFTVVR